MSLLEIYELLQLIKSNYIENSIDQSILALTLSVEASLIFAKKENKLSYDALLVFALSPSGYLKKHLVELFGNKWSEWEHLLVSRSLINFKFIEIGKDSKIEYFTMDSSLSKIIKSRTNQDEIDDSYKKITLKLIEIMNESYKLKNSEQERMADMLVQYEGTIWSILQKLKQDAEEEEHSASNLSLGSDKSWSDSSTTTKRNNFDFPSGNYFINVAASEARANPLMRADTYKERKNSLMVRLFTGISPDKNEIFDSKRYSRQDSEDKVSLSKADKNNQIFKKSEIDCVKDMIKNIVINTRKQNLDQEVNKLEESKQQSMIQNMDSKLDEIDHFEIGIIEIDEIDLSVDSKIIQDEENKRIEDIISIFKKSVHAKVHK